MLIHFGHFPSAAGFFSDVATTEAEDMAAATMGTTGLLFFYWSATWMCGTATMLRR